MNKSDVELRRMTISARWPFLFRSGNWRQWMRDRLCCLVTLHY